MRNILIRSVILFFSATSLLVPDNLRGADQSQWIIDAFGNSCSSFQSYSRAALDYQNAFAQILANIKDDPNCSALRNHLDASKILAQHLHLLYSNPQKVERAERHQRFLYDIVNELSFDGSSFSSGINPESLTSFVSSVMLPDFAKAFSRAMIGDYGRRLEATQAELERRKLVDAELGNYIHGLTTAITQSRECLLNQPNIAATLISQAIVLGGFYSKSEVGGALVLAGTLLNELTYLISNLRVSLAITNLQKSKLYAAIACGAEAITSTYCEAQDAKVLLNQNASSLTQNESTIEDTWRGVELISRDIPILQRWINLVDAGTPSTTIYGAKRKTAVDEKLNTITTSKRSFTARVQETRILLEETENPQARNGIIQNFVSNVSQDFFYSTTEISPFAEEYPSEGSCGFRVEAYTGSQNIPLSEAGDVQSCSNYESFIAKQANDLEKVFKNIQLILNRIEERVNRERARVLNDDPFSIIAESFKEDASGRSAVQVLDKVSAYLEALEARAEKKAPSEKTMLTFVDDTNQKIEYVIGLLHQINSKLQPTRGSATAPASNQSLSEQILIEVNRTFRITEDVNYFSRRVYQIVDWDILTNVRAGQYSEPLSDLIRIAISDITQSMLSSNNPSRSLNDLLRDVNLATVLSQTTINEYIGFLGPMIIEGIAHYRKQAKAILESASDPYASNTQRAAELCLLALPASDSVLKWKVSKGFKGLDDYCHNLTLLSVHHADSKISLDWVTESRRSQKERICAFTNYRAKNRIFETQALILKEK